MLLKEISIDDRKERGDVSWGAPFPSYLEHQEIEIKVRVAVEHTDGPILFSPTAEGVIEMIRACKTPAGLTDSSLESSGRQHQPIIVVSLRVDADGCPSFSMSMAPGSTEVLPLDLTVITPQGELASIAVPVEIRASVH